MRSVARQRRAYRLDALPNQHRYPNRLRRNFQAQQPNQKWVTDVTYVQTSQGTLYLSVIKDLFDGFIVAYQTSASNSLDLVLNTLQLALSRQRVSAGLALHSDQGFQYSSQSYFLLARQHQIQPSMSRRANCWDNAVIENFFSHLKAEALRRMKLESLEQAKEAIDDYIDFYNYHRIQLKTKLTPFELRCQSL
ncbi:MAG: IS3 family transposase [Anaerolineales bacterium]